MQIKLGADPEIFVKNPNSGIYQSAHGMVPGTKYNPYVVPLGAIQVDGMALEFNIDPVTNVDDWVKNINGVKDELARRVPGYILDAVPVAHFDPAYLASQPDEAKELGCEPDFNAWDNGRKNPRPNGDQPFRTGSGHIHVGWTEDADIRSKNHLADCMAVVRQMDYYLGIQSLLWDKDGQRRSMYGKAGAFRPKSYGVEYRVLSNAWLKSDKLIRWVYEASVLAVSDLAAGKIAEEQYGDLARTIIDGSVLDWQERYPDLDNRLGSDRVLQIAA